MTAPRGVHRPRPGVMREVALAELALGPATTAAIAARRGLRHDSLAVVMTDLRRAGLIVHTRRGGANRVEYLWERVKGPPRPLPPLSEHRIRFSSAAPRCEVCGRKHWPIADGRSCRQIEDALDGTEDDGYAGPEGLARKVHRRAEGGLALCGRISAEERVTTEDAAAVTCGNCAAKMRSAADPALRWLERGAPIAVPPEARTTPPDYCFPGAAVARRV